MNAQTLSLVRVKTPEVLLMQSQEHIMKLSTIIVYHDEIWNCVCWDLQLVLHSANLD